MKTNESQFPISHVATGGRSLNLGRITTSAGNRGGAFSRQEVGFAKLPTGKKNKPGLLGGSSIDTSARPAEGDKQTAFNAASTDLNKKLSEGTFVDQAKKDSAMEDTYRKAQGLVGSGKDRPVIKIRSN
jgi:hypothetical protein